MNRNVKPIKTKEMFARDLKISSTNILLMVALTLVNIIMIVANTNSTFFFSAAVPKYLVLLFHELCGKYSPEFYEEFYGANWEEFPFLPDGAYWAVVVAAIVIVAAYVLLWYLAKKKKVFTTILMVVFAIDTLGLLVFNTMVYAFDFSAIVDLAFHAWVFYYLVLALKAWDGMEYAPSEAELAAQYMPVMPEVTPDTVEDTAEVVEEGGETVETVSEE